MFSVDRNVAIPSRVGKTSKYPLSQMMVGDSFFVPAKDTKPTTVTSGCANIAKKINIKLSFRTVTEGGVPGIRVWRVA